MEFHIAILSQPGQKKAAEVMRDYYSICGMVSIHEVDFRKNFEHLYRNDILKKLINNDMVFELNVGEIIEQIVFVNLKKIPYYQNSANDKDWHHKILRMPSMNYIEIDKIEIGVNHLPVVAVNPQEISFYSNRCVKMNDPYEYKKFCVHNLANIIGKPFVYEKKSEIELGEKNFDKSRKYDIINTSPDILEIATKFSMIGQVKATRKSSKKVVANADGLCATEQK
jgi:hypothetical protein